MQEPSCPEQSFLFGPHRNLVGTYTPAGGSTPRGVTFVLMNVGVIPRTGLHRMNVRLARRLAAHGFATLRFDLSGLGDSLDAGDGLPFEARHRADLRDAMDVLDSRQAPTGPAPGRYVLLGFCAGADLAYQVAQEDPRVAGVVLYDGFMYPTWKTHLIRYALRLRENGPGTLWQGLTRRLSRGRVGAPAPTPPAAPALIASRPRPTRAAYAAGLQQLLSRGTAVYLLFSASFLGLYNHAGQFAAGFRRWGLHRQVHSDFLREADHTLIDQRAQQFFLEHIAAWACRAFEPR